MPAGDASVLKPIPLRVRAADSAEADLQVSQPSGARFGVLWLPAMGVTARHYQSFAAALADKGIATAIHEWRGAGSSSLRASRDCNWGYRELLQLDVPASLAAARQEFPRLRWIIAGHSLGGQLAALFAASDPERVDGFAFAASGSPYWRLFSGRMRRVLRAVPVLVAAVTAVCGYYPGKRLGFAGREASGVMRDWAKTSRAGCYESYGAAQSAEVQLQRFAKPVLGIRLENDRLCPEASFQWLLGKFSNGAVSRSLLSVPDFQSGVANHFSWMKDPAPVAETIAEWLHSIESSAE